MHTLTPAAERLTTRLSQYPPALGVFLPAGFPAPGLDVQTLRLLADAGADILEIGLPTPHTPLDGPVVREASRQALAHGTQAEQALATVRRTAEATDAIILVMTYWEPVRHYGPQFARDLAAAGAAGALIPDLPPSAATAWTTAVRSAGLHNLQFVPRHGTDRELRTQTATASGWLYTPAATQPTGYQGQLDIPALRTFTHRLRQHSDVPVVTGVGISTPELASLVAPFVSAVVVGSPIVRCLLQHPGLTGRLSAADATALFADSIRSAGRAAAVASGELHG